MFFYRKKGGMSLIKKFISLFILFTLVLSTGYISYADNPQDAIINSKMKFQQMNENIMSTNKQISSLNIEMAKINNDINKNTIDISKNNKDIENEKIHMQLLIKQVNSTQELANKRLRAMYINGYDENFISILLSSKNISDFLYKYDAIKNIISFDKKVFNDLEIKKSILNESVANLSFKKQKLQKLKDLNTESLKKINNDKNNLQALIIQFNKEKNSAVQIIKENEEKLIAHAISVIDSSASNIPEMKSALVTLNSLISQISTSSVKKKAQSYIDSGNKKLAEMIAKNTVPIINDNTAYKATYSMDSTAYTGGTLTALGLKPIRDPENLSTIAVDPSVIPLGTKVYIPGYGNAICSDTGSAIKGNIVDLYMNTEEDCYNWGRKNVTLYIVAYPGEW
jgi:peptidoglycan DL-endopeptidase CwlO